MSKISIIAAMAENSVLGDQNRLLWHLPNDLKRFKALTMGKPIIMGRKTYESIGKPLPGRRNIVLTRQNKVIPGCEVVHTLEACLRLTQEAPEIMVIGGGEIYRLFFDHATTMYLTYVHADFTGDTAFLSFNPNQWKERAREAHTQDEKHAYDYCFVILDRHH